MGGGTKKGCCCNRCYVKATADTGDNCYKCCRCLPKRACVRLYTTSEDCPCATEDIAVAAVSNQAAVDCSGEWPTYVAILYCGGSPITLSFTFEKDEEGCWVYLESACLGYTGEDRLRVPIGGEDHDDPTRRENCIAFGFEFDVDLSGCEYECGAGIISLELDEMLLWEEEYNEPEDCIYGRVCICHDPAGPDSGASKTCEKVCVDGEGVDASWEAELDAGDVLISVESESPLILSLSTSGGLSAPVEPNQEAECPGMRTVWELENGDTISVLGERRIVVNDSTCRCHCECICVTYRESETTNAPMRRALACWDEDYQGWTAVLSDPLEIDPDVSISFSRRHDHCTGNSYLVLEGSADPDNERQLTECPNFNVGWAVHDYHGEEGEAVDITVQCAGCTDCTAPTIVEDCQACPEIPVTLTVTIENTNADCACAEGLTATIVYDFDPISPAWRGTFTTGCFNGVTVELTCSGEYGCDGAFRLNLSCFPNNDANTGDCSCDPLEIVFTGQGGGCGQCDEPATSQFDVRITE
jgi:hypothetical protein